MIHVWRDEHTGETEVWFDTEVGERDGVCLSSRKTREAALAEAASELKEATEKVSALIDADRPKIAPSYPPPMSLGDVAKGALGIT